MAESSFDLIVVGGGPGGYVAAIRAAQLGMKTAVVEREHLGGICLNWGCIPTKALLRSSEIYHLLHRLDDFGFSAKDISFDAGKVVARSRAVAKQLSNGVAYLLRKNKVTVFDGHGRLAGKGRLAVTKDGNPVAELAAEHIVLATGATGAQLARARARWRASVDLQGGDGAAGDPQIAAGRRLGRDRHRIRQLLPRHGRRGDGRRSARPRAARSRTRKSRPLRANHSRSRGSRSIPRLPWRRLEHGGDGVTARIEADGKAFEANVERVILAVGIVGNVEDIGLEKTRVSSSTGPTSSSTNGCAPASRGSTRSAMSSGRPGWRTRRATRG